MKIELTKDQASQIVSALNRIGIYVGRDRNDPADEDLIIEAGHAAFEASRKIIEPVLAKELLRDANCNEAQIASEQIEAGIGAWYILNQMLRKRLAAYLPQQDKAVDRLTGLEIRGSGMGITLTKEQAKSITDMVRAAYKEQQ